MSSKNVKCRIERDREQASIGSILWVFTIQLIFFFQNVSITNGKNAFSVHIHTKHTIMMTFEKYASKKKTRNTILSFTSTIHGDTIYKILTNLWNILNIFHSFFVLKTNVYGFFFCFCRVFFLFRWFTDDKIRKLSLTNNIILCIGSSLHECQNATAYTNTIKIHLSARRKC